jgi:HK97 family phage prohead protease
MANMIRRAMATEIRLAGDSASTREIECFISSQNVDRMGDIVVQAGVDLTNFRRSPTILWQHDSDRPIARAISIGLKDGKLAATAKFPQPGEVALCDEIFALIKAGVVNSTSIGFRPIEMTPIDRSEPWGAQRISKSELIEFSFVSCPANIDAAITARSARDGRADDPVEQRIAHARRIKAEIQLSLAGVPLADIGCILDGLQRDRARLEREWSRATTHD